VYTYKVLNSKKVEDVERYANEQAKKGWELMQCVTAQDRYVSIFRKLEVTPDDGSPRVRFIE
jgi:hypothetical protein